MNTLARTLIATTLIATTALASAGPRYGHHQRHYHHHHHRGSGLDALAVGLAVTVPLIALAHQAERAPEVVYVPPAPLPPPAPVYAPSRPAPVIYPRQGQDNVQLEHDSRACNRWATTQPAAMADASVFHRAVEACMDGRGYTLR